VVSVANILRNGFKAHNRRMLSRSRSMGKGRHTRISLVGGLAKTFSIVVCGLPLGRMWTPTTRGRAIYFERGPLRRSAGLSLCARPWLQPRIVPFRSTSYPRHQRENPSQNYTDCRFKFYSYRYGNRRKAASELQPNSAPSARRDSLRCRCPY